MVSRFQKLAGGLALAACGFAGCSGDAQRESIARGDDARVETASGPSSEGVVSRSHGKLELLSPVYKIDRIYRSMTGPWSRVKVCLLETPQPELLWITGCRVEMVDADAEESLSPQFMGRVNLDLDSEQHKQLFHIKSFRDERLFTLSQGQLEVRFPAGFGVPIRSDELVDVTTQALNLNHSDETVAVRHHVTIDYVRECDVVGKMQPLYECSVVGLVSLEGHEVAFDAQELTGGAKCVPCCAAGKKAVEWAEGLDRYARRFSNHWVVKPGRSAYRTRATTTLGLTSDTTLHAIAVHLHPFADQIELRDSTDGRTVFCSRAYNLTDEIGLDRVDSFASGQGLPLLKDHEYELVTTYDNVTDQDQDAMAVMSVYLLDKEYRRPELSGDLRSAAPATEPGPAERPALSPVAEQPVLVAAPNGGSSPSPPAEAAETNSLRDGSGDVGSQRPAR